jgi:hypothetical protein
LTRNLHLSELPYSKTRGNAATGGYSLAFSQKGRSEKQEVALYGKVARLGAWQQARARVRVLLTEIAFPCSWRRVLQEIAPPYGSSSCASACGLRT